MDDRRRWLREQGFDVGERGPLPPAAIQAWDDALALGLVKKQPRFKTEVARPEDVQRSVASRCTMWMEDYDRFCRQGRVPGTEFCAIHGGAAIVESRGAAQLRDVITQTILPVAVERMRAIILDPDEKTENIIKAFVALADRGGLAAVQGVMLEGNITVEAPLDVLRRMLEPSSSPEILEGEIVEPEPVVEDKDTAA